VLIVFQQVLLQKAHWTMTTREALCVFEWKEKKKKEFCFGQSKKKKKNPKNGNCSFFLNIFI
jgi:hypothetical protein